MTVALAVTFKILGAAFLLAAAVGLLRFADPLQRMHASTKAGTVGAGFVLLGTMVSLWETGVVATGLATLVFLLLTIPIAGHLLGRAAYISGARLNGLRGPDALASVVERRSAELDERLAREERPC